MMLPLAYTSVANDVNSNAIAHEHEIENKMPQDGMFGFNKRNERLHNFIQNAWNQFCYTIYITIRVTLDQSS